MRRQGAKGYRVICGRCGACGPYSAIAGDKMAAQSAAIEAWNRRVEQCVKLLEYAPVVRCKDCKQMIFAAMENERTRRRISGDEQQ